MRTLPFLSLFLAAALSACIQAPPIGAATRANLAQQVVDPAPEHVANDGNASSTARSVAAVKRYAAGRVLQPVKP